MVASTFLWTTAVLISAATASPLGARREYHQQSRRSAPHGFSSLGAAPSTHALKLRIALTSNNVSGLESALLDVSTPSSPNYGKHLTKDEVNAFLAPSSQALAAVQNWLANNNISASSEAAGDWLTIKLPVSQANTLLNANFEMYQHAATGNTYARTLSLALPDTVAPFIEHIHPTTEFNSPLATRPVLSIPQAKGRGGGGGGGGNGGGGGGRGGGGRGGTGGGNGGGAAQTTAVTPATLQSLYGIPTTPATQKSNSIAVSGFIEQFAQQADLQSFLTNFRTDINPKTTFALQTLDGGQNTQSARQAGTEALDIQYTVGIATGVPITFVSVGEQTQDGALGGFLDIVNFLSAETNIPQVLTTSYGENENDIPPALAFKLCTAYMGLGARGTSVLFASGDGGVEGGSAQTCKTFVPAFPGSCPYLTAVGSVHGTGPEIASDFSSGGFSNIFNAPAYQADAVAGYLALLGNTNAGLFNASGRGFPDVAAQGENVQIVSGGSTGGVDGTSCSSPIFASVIGLINDGLVAAGKSPLGFLNPFLYSNAAALNDVTAGSNPGCGTNGFPALKGWDAVTGLGTPNFAALASAAGL
ncbi:family S53 protease-like protein [Mycena amicta]|nr:family S53 protease-like protein [Mycena amicta]